MTAERPLQIAAFDIDGEYVVAVDEVLPVAVEVALATGQVVRTHTWELSPSHRGRPTASDVLLLPTDIVVASPAAGGVVRINRTTGTAATVVLEEDVGWLVRDDDVVWAVADADWAFDDEGERTTDPGLGRHPIAWEEPTEADMERYRAQMAGWSVRTPGGAHDEWEPLVDPDESLPTADDWRDEEDDQDLVNAPTPVWRIAGADVSRLDLGVDDLALAAVNGQLIAVGRRPNDVLIKVVEPGGSLSYARPSTVLIGHPEHGLEVTGAVADDGGQVCADRDRVWLVGFDRLEDRCEACEVDVEQRTIGEPVLLRAENVIAIVAERAIEVTWQGGPSWEHPHVSSPRSQVVRILPLTQAEPMEVAVPPVDEEQHRVVGSTVWLRRVETQGLVAVNIETAEVKELVLNFDCASFAPRPSLPRGFDNKQFERGEVERLRGAFFGGWHSESGEQRPFIEGVTFESVELDGEFPQTSVVARFTSDRRPGVRFGRRWSLYDALGNPESLEYADIGLMEDVEAAGYGLPPMNQCEPDETGIVWF